MKLPAFQFYPGDWMKDPNLRRCSRAARGMWADILCLMFECEDRGVLATGGEPWTDEDIAAAAGGDIAEGLSCIAELLRKGVARRNQAGAIFSKRMVKDEQERRQAAERKRRERAGTSQRGHASVTPSSRNSHGASSSSPSPSEKTHTRAREDLPTQENQAVEIFQEVYSAQMDIFSQERVTAEVVDLTTWRQVLVKNRANGIPPTKVGTLLDIYHEKAKKPSAKKGYR